MKEIKDLFDIIKNILFYEMEYWNLIPQTCVEKILLNVFLTTNFITNNSCNGSWWRRSVRRRRRRWLYKLGVKSFTRKFEFWSSYCELGEEEEEEEDCCEEFCNKVWILELLQNLRKKKKKKEEGCCGICCEEFCSNWMELGNKKKF